MANEQLRESVADILAALVDGSSPRQAGYLIRGARTLCWAERFEFGDPVPADEVQDRINGVIDDEFGDGTADLRREVEALRALVAPGKLAKHDAKAGRS